MKSIYIFLTLQFMILGLLLANFWATLMQTDEMKRVANVEAAHAVAKHDMAVQCSKFNTTFGIK